MTDIVEKLGAVTASLANPQVAVDAQREIESLRAELDSAKAELDLRRKSGSASDRLHNICRALADEADGSAWSREEWDKLDTENANLRAALKVTADQAQYVESLRTDRANLLSELLAVKALLREALKWPVPISWAADVRAALGDEPADPRPGHKPE